jgi:hypothetical protein
VWAAGNGDCEVKVTLTTVGPPMPIGVADDTFFENLYSVIRDSNGSPNPLEMLYQLANNDVYLAGFSRTLVQLLYGAVNIIAPLLGFKRHYEEYTTNMHLIPPELR